MKHTWTEHSMSKLLANATFLNRSVLVVPRCSWTGHEADLLVIEPNLRIVDIEIKVSRQDLKADLKKDKWWKGRPWSRRHLPRERRAWPEKVWKHYYAIPAAIWSDDLMATIPEVSGILLVGATVGKLVDGTGCRISVRRPAKPNRDAKPISPADAIDIARLCSLRYWALTRKEP